MKNRKIITILLGILIVSYLIYNAFFNRVQAYKKTFFYLGTVIDITLYEEAENVFDQIEESIQKYDQMFDRNNPESDVYKLNHHQGTIHEETLYLLNKSIDYSQISKGYFDITINPIVDLWQINTDNAHIPDQIEIDSALERVDYRNIDLENYDFNGSTIDLGGIAKGFIADEIKKVLVENDIENALINLGGNVYAHGESISGGNWSIGIRNPYPNENNAILKIMVSDASVVTSGIYERFFEVDGKIYHHIFNPFTGYPIDNNIISLTVISDQSIDGDALSTSLFALGLEEAFSLADQLDVNIIVITNDNTIYVSEDLKDIFESFVDYTVVFR